MKQKEKKKPKKKYKKHIDIRRDTRVHTYRNPEIP